MKSLVVPLVNPQVPGAEGELKQNAIIYFCFLESSQVLPGLRNVAGHDPHTEPGEGPSRTSGCRWDTRGNSHSHPCDGRRAAGSPAGTGW